ncbi:transposase [Streptomyces sp. NBRC 110611]|nr:transposase [Streptomyces sp. NBRC 110611]
MAPTVSAGQAGDALAFELVAFELVMARIRVPHCINRLKQWRGLAMRTDKLALAYQAALHLAAILIWARR